MEDIRKEKCLKCLSAAGLLVGLFQLAAGSVLYILLMTEWFLWLFAVENMDFSIWNTGWLLLTAAAITNPALSLAIVNFTTLNLTAPMRREPLLRRRKRLLSAGRAFLAGMAVLAIAAAYVRLAAAYL